jgi:hypothetical protein
MKGLIIASVFLTFFSIKSYSQTIHSNERLIGSSEIAFKTNALYDLTSTINAGFEIKTGSQYTFDLSDQVENPVGSIISSK